MPALKTDADVPGNEVLHAFADFRTVPRAQAQALTDFGGTHRIGGIGKPKPGPAAEPYVAAAAAHPCAHGFPPFSPSAADLCRAVPPGTRRRDVLSESAP